MMHQEGLYFLTESDVRKIMKRTNMHYGKDNDDGTISFEEFLALTTSMKSTTTGDVARHVRAIATAIPHRHSTHPFHTAIPHLRSTSPSHTSISHWHSAPHRPFLSVYRPAVRAHPQYPRDAIAFRTPCAHPVRPRVSSQLGSKFLSSIFESLSDEEQKTCRGRLGGFVDSNRVAIFILILVVIDFGAVLGELFIHFTLVEVCDYHCSSGGFPDLHLNAHFIEHHMGLDSGGAFCIADSAINMSSSSSGHRRLEALDHHEEASTVTCANFTGLECSLSCHHDPLQFKVEQGLHYVSVAALSVVMTQILLQMLAYGIKFWYRIDYIIDFLIVGVALVIENLPTTIKGEELVIFLLTWRFLRVGHGLLFAQDIIHTRQERKIKQIAFEAARRADVKNDKKAKVFPPPVIKPSLLS